MKNLFIKEKISRQDRVRPLRCEVLEDRLLLSVTLGISSTELQEIKSEYSNFDYQGISATEVIVVAADSGSNEIARADLLDALTYANEQEGADMIVVRTTDTANTIKYSSESDLITISDWEGVTIIAYGSKPLTIDANAFDDTYNTRIIINQVNYQLGGKESPSFLQIGYVDFINGYTEEYGGAIYNFKSTLILDNCYFYNNAARMGGGIYSNNTDNNSLQIYNTTFEKNNAFYSGGGINFTRGNVVLQNSFFYDNTATSQGGAMVTQSSDMTLSDLFFSGNKAQNGGAVFGVSGSLALNYCTFVRNEALDNGGAIFNSADDLFVLNSSLYENKAELYGGAIYAKGSSTSVIGSTIAENTAKTYGGGIYNSAFYLTILNSILLWNTANSNADLYSTVQKNTALAKNVFYGSSSYSYSNVTIDTGLNKLIAYRSSYKLKQLNVFASIDSKTGLVIPDSDGTLALYTSGNADSAGTLTGYIQGNSGLNYYYLETVNKNKYWINAFDKTVNIAFDSSNSDGYYGLSLGAGTDEITKIFDKAQNFIDGFPASRTFNLNAFAAGAWSGYYEKASTIVTTIVDRVDNGDGLISLREAIRYAKEGDVITFAPVLYDQKGNVTSDRRIILTDGALQFNNSVTINGQGTGIILDLNQGDPLLYVYGDSVLVEISGLTMTGALSGSEFTNAGQNYACSIFNSADLILINCTITENRIVAAVENGSNGSLRYGSAICNIGTMALIGCTVTGNESIISFDSSGSVLGGTVFNEGTLTVINSILTGNDPQLDCAFDLVNKGTAAVIYSVYGRYLGSLAVNVEDVMAEGDEVFILNDSERVTDSAGISIPSVAGAAWKAGTLVARKDSELYYVYWSDDNLNPVWVRVSDGKTIGNYDAADTADYGLNITGAELFLAAQNFTSAGSSASRMIEPGQITAGAWTSSDISVDSFLQISAGQSLMITMSDPADIISQWRVNIYNASDSELKTSLITGEFEMNEFAVNTAFLTSGDYIVKINACNSKGTLVQTLKSNLTVRDPQPEFFIVKNNYCENQLIRLEICTAIPSNELFTSWMINWGDNSTNQFFDKTFSLSAVHYYESMGVFSITLSVTTDSGIWNEKIWSIAVHYVNGDRISDQSSASEGVVSASDPNDAGRITPELFSAIDWDLLLVSLEEEKIRCK